MYIIYNILGYIIQCLAFSLFCFTSAYVFCLGKTGSGIRMDYIFFSMMCGVVFLTL